jgi:hypothetical protein
MKFFTKLFWCALLLMPIGIHAQAPSAGTLPELSTYIKPGVKPSKGMFNVYLQDSKYLIEIPNQILGRDILTSISIIAGSAQRKRNPAMRFGFAGDAVSDQVIRLKKNNSKIEIVAPEYVQANDTTNIYLKSLRAGLLPSLLALDIIAVTDTSSLIDITRLFSDDNELFSLKGAKDELKLGNYDVNKSKILGVSCFDNNIVFRSVKSYSAGPPPPPVPAPPGSLPAKSAETYPTTWVVGSSWYLLPEKPMTPRYFDRRVGFFQTVSNNYDQDSLSVEKLGMANRWRMEPRATDVEKYKKGELVEPEKPIVFYIDRNTPTYLIPYIIQGVNSWQSSFEKIGFKNAIIGKLVPTAVEDPNFSMEDARYSYISYKPSAMANAYGPQVVDPRSGEILSSHVAVFHSILELLQRWYFSMCAATDPAARKFPLDQALIGSMLKNVITHEIGHTIGLRHNFAGSSSFEIDSIRSPEYVRKNSFGPSVMDYMRFNYVAQPEDHMSPEDLLPKIGVYDDFAIEWGYRYLPDFKNAFAEKKYLSDWVSLKRKDPKLFYLEEGDLYDPRVQSEDVGNNNMKANRLGVENLKRTMANLEKWTAGDDDGHITLRSMYRAIEGRYYIYLGHMLKNLGGVQRDYALRSENKPSYMPVSYEQQKEAMAYFTEFMFTEPKWLYPKGIQDKTRFNFNTDVEESYSDLFGRLLLKYLAITKVEERVGDKAYHLSEFLDDLYSAIFRDISSGKPISEYQRMFQRTFVNKMLSNVDNKNNLSNNVSVEMIRILDRLSNEAAAAAANNNDLISRSHLSSLYHMIQVWRSGKKEVLLTNMPASPIKP